MTPPDLPIRRDADLSGADLAGRDLRGADLRGACLRGADLRGADLSRADLRAADLRDVDGTCARWTAADLSGADLSRARLLRADFDRATLDGADLRHSDLNRARFDRASLRRAALSGARVTAARLTRADLTAARLTGARLAGSDLGGSVLRDAVVLGARLARCDLVGVDLQRCRLAGVDFRGTRLAHADLRGADLRGADLRGTDLRGARLDDACLAEVHAAWTRFDRASMARADLRGATLTWAHLDRLSAPELDLRDADLHGAWLDGVLTDARLEETRLTGGWFGGDWRGARLDGADLRGSRPVALRAPDARADGVRVDPAALDALVAAGLDGRFVIDIPPPLHGQVVYRTTDGQFRVTVRDEPPCEGLGLTVAVPGPRIRIERRPPRERPTRWTGDPAFDDTLALASPIPVDTLARLDGPLRRALLRWIGWGGRVYAGAVRLDTPTTLAGPLTTALDIALALAEPLPEASRTLMSRLPAEPEAVARRLLARWMVAADPPRVPSRWAVDPRTREGALVDLVRHGPAQAWAVRRLARGGLRLGPIDAEGADLRGIDLGDLQLQDARFAGADLSGARLEGVCAHRIDLRGANLRGARLNGALLEGADLRGACLDGAQLAGARLRHADLRGADLSGAELREADLLLARLDGCRAPYARFTAARLSHTRFDGCDAPGARFSHVEACDISFADARLVRASYEGARLSEICWHRADLQRARFRGAHIERASFAGADTRLAAFDDAHLDRVLLARCRLDGGLVGARLEAVDLRRSALAGEIDRAVFAGVDLRGATVTPESLRRLRLEAVRIDLAAIAGLFAGRGEPERPRPLFGVDGAYRFCWHRDAYPVVTLWPLRDDAGPDDMPAPVAAPPIPDTPSHGMPSDEARHGRPGPTDDRPNATGDIRRSVPDDMLRAIDVMADALARGFAEPDPPLPDLQAPDVGRATLARLHLPWAPADIGLTSEGALGRLRKAFGAAEPQIGDPPFDAAVFIDCADPAALQARLDAELRAALMRWINDGGALTDGALRMPGPLDPDRVLPTLRDGLALLRRLKRPIDVPVALLAQAHSAAQQSVRAAALARWMLLDGLRLPPEPHALPTGTLEAALLLLLDDGAADPATLIDWLGEWGTEAAVPALAAIGGRWLTARALAARVDRAISAIARRVGGLRSGGLSVSAGADDGRISPVDDEPA